MRTAADERVTAAVGAARPWPGGADCGTVEPVAVVPVSWRQRERPSAGVVARLALGGLFVVHGLWHLAWFVRQGDEAWPFRLDSEWLLHESVWRPVATGLVLVAAAGFVLVGLAVAGVRRLSPLWPGVAAPTASASLLVIVVFWHPPLLLGAVVDVVTVAAAWWWTEWRARE